ncbi:hypothetical protein [Glycomyces buryatensis]|uniref:Uncharacterized protein n=1 Tax=Glycomyces buryatensis TaxID=2570927 RepID=A0A4S8QNG8_9ACTN|nr:hypothetical protein [Glycomyces buryatensis]THV42989.1 hypothetical protein FAB82_03275 [Glycomyces buryatensis]
METYTVIFVEEVDLRELARAVSDVFVVAPARIEIWDGDDFADPSAEPGIAQVAAGEQEGAFAEFVGFQGFIDHIGSASRLEVALRLVQRLKKRALIAPESAEEYRWTLIAADGSHGKVVLDGSDLADGILTIVSASEPISGAPDVRVSRFDWLP